MSSSARVEYRYTDLGKTGVTVENEEVGTANFEVDNTFHAVRVGLSSHSGAISIRLMACSSALKMGPVGHPAGRFSFRRLCLAANQVPA